MSQEPESGTQARVLVPAMGKRCRMNINLSISEIPPQLFNSFWRGGEALHQLKQNKTKWKRKTTAGKINGISPSLIFKNVPLKESNSSTFLYTYMQSIPIKITMCLKGKAWAVSAPWVMGRHKQMNTELMGWFCHLHCPLFLPLDSREYLA